MDRLLDARGLSCPLPAVEARAALAGLADGDALVVLATDREAPVDIGALATERNRPFRAEREPDGAWRLRIGPLALDV